MVIYGTEKEIDVERIRMVVLGRSTEMPRTTAINLLQKHEYLNKHKDFQTVLENNNEPTILRYLSAVNLGKTNVADAQDILIKNIRIDDERVLTGVVEALGYIGDSRAIPTLMSVKESKKGLVSSKASFAIALISYRLGLNGNELPTPTEEESLKLSDDTKPIKISPASREEINNCIKFISDRQFGIQLALEPVYQVIIEKDMHLLFLNKQYAEIEKTKQLLQRKSILGIVAYKSEEHESYSVEYLVLSSPATQPDGNIDVVITRPEGNIIFSGVLHIKDNNIKFSVHSVSRPGGFPLVIEGSLIDKKLNLRSAHFSSSGKISKQPKKAS